MTKPIVVTCYVDPDLDGVAGAMAYAEFLQKSGRNAIAGVIGQPHPEALYVLDRFSIPGPERLVNADSFDAVILVDASDLNGVEGKISPAKVIEIIDHRAVHEASKFINAKVHIELVGAAATLIAEKYIQAGIAISQNSARLLYAAIISNTLNFQGGVTTERDRQASTWLNQTAKLSNNFWKELFLAKSDLSGQKLQQRIEGDFAWFALGNKKVGIAQIEMIGAKKLVEERQSEIIAIIRQLKARLGLDFVFQNTIALEESKNYFVAEDEQIKKILQKVLQLNFVGMIAETPSLIMRKQIVPLLQKELS